VGLPVEKGSSLNGITFPASVNVRLPGGGEINLNPYTNYTANNRERARSYFNGLAGRIGTFQYTQIHELGNSIAAISGVDVGISTDTSGDGDSGQQLVECMADKLTKGK
jgi:hypothetical protein